MRLVGYPIIYMVFIHPQVVNRISCINGWPVPLMWGGIQRFARCCKESKKQMGGINLNNKNKLWFPTSSHFVSAYLFFRLENHVDALASLLCTQTLLIWRDLIRSLKCPWPEQPNRDWKHWDMGRNQISPAFLCYNNWTVHASAIAVYINVPTGVHPLAQIATHSLPKLEQCNKQIFSLGNCPDRPL